MGERMRADEPFETFVERQIREARERGEFDNLRGKGEPLRFLDEPYDEMWWVKEKLLQENLSLLPESMELLRDVERTLESVRTLRSEAVLRSRLEELNARIRRQNATNLSGPATRAAVLDVEELVRKWRSGGL